MRCPLLYWEVWSLLNSLWFFFFFKQKTAYEMRISDWSSDVCSSDLCHRAIRTLVVDYEQKTAARSQEKLIYRHAIHVITAVMMKRLRQRVGAAAVIDAATILGLISHPLDELRQHTLPLGRPRLPGADPLAVFCNPARHTSAH